MSGVYLVVCHSCPYSQGFKFGIGAKYSRLDQAVGLLHPESRSKVQQILDNNGLSQTEFGYRAFHCTTCNNLCDGFWVRIEQDRRNVYETAFFCSKCGERMASVSEPESIMTAPCPDCYKADLEPVKVMSWD